MVTSNRSPPGHLPDELIQEIFLKLPQNSLVRFRSLSKSWKDYITNPSFVLKYARLRFARGKPTLMLIHNEFNEIYSQIVSINAAGVLKPIRHLVRKVRAHCNFKAISYSMGIFCLFGSYGNSALWNPATRSMMKVSFKYLDDGFDIQGFGFGHFCNDGMVDLKILWLVNVLCDQGWRCRFRIYMVRSDEWHWAKPSIAADGFGGTAGVEVDGVLHWIGKDSAQDGDLFILTFDLSNETCGRINLPKGVDLSYECRMELHASFYVQSPSLVLICAGNNSIDLWTMKKYGDRRSWIRQVIVVKPGIETRFLGHCSFTNQSVLCKYKKGPARLSVSMFNYVENRMSLEDYSWMMDLLRRYPE